jgi:hypothetical protein
MVCRRIKGLVYLEIKRSNLLFPYAPARMQNTRNFISGFMYLLSANQRKRLLIV